MMNRVHSVSCCVLLLTSAVTCAAGEGVSFEKHVIDAGFPAISAAAMDVDGDGLLDVVASGGPSGGKSEWSHLVRWYRAPLWEMAPVCELEEGAIILHMERVNFLGESGLQTAQVSVTDGHFGDIWWCRFDKGTGKWVTMRVVDGVKYCHGTASGDVDRDGFDDLLVPYQPDRENQGMLWAENPGPGDAGAAWPKHKLASSFAIDGWLHYVRLWDVNGDDRLDALLGSSGKDGWFGFWTQPADPGAEWPARKLEGPMRKATNLTAGDVDGDGLVDLIGTEGHGTGLWVFKSPDYAPTRVDETLTNAHCVALGDYDGNGALDIVSCGFGNKRVACLLNDGQGQFSTVTVDSDQCAYDALTVDLDADGDEDILLSGQKSGNLVWYENLRVR